MVRAQASTVIRRSPEEVYRFIAVDFFRNYPRWSPEVVELCATTPGPVRVGTAGRQVRVDQGRRSESVFRVTDLEDGRRIVFQGGPSPFRLAYHFEGREAATHLTLAFELQRLDLLMRPFEKLIRVAVQDGVERVVRNLKTLIEAEVPPGAAGRPPAS
jgi:hypothetical protein